VPRKAGRDIRKRLPQGRNCSADGLSIGHPEPRHADDHTTHALLVDDLLLAKRELRSTELELGFVLSTKKPCPRWCLRPNGSLPIDQNWRGKPSRITVDFSGCSRETPRRWHKSLKAFIQGEPSGSSAMPPFSVQPLKHCDLFCACILCKSVSETVFRHPYKSVFVRGPASGASG
jgi:hypothetical protein